MYTVFERQYVYLIKRGGGVLSMLDVQEINENQRHSLNFWNMHIKDGISQLSMILCWSCQDLLKEQEEREIITPKLPLHQCLYSTPERSGKTTDNKKQTTLSETVSYQAVIECTQTIAPTHLFTEESRPQLIP